MLNRLLNHLYRVFDKNPDPVLALRLNHPDGLAWQIANREINLQTTSGQSIGRIPLKGKNITALAREVAALDVTVTYQNASIGHRAADALLEGTGRQSMSNGDHLYLYDSLLYALLDAYADELETADHYGIINGIKQAHFDSACGEWLDYWGEYFGVYRESDEKDEDYLRRIVLEVLRPRNNGIAIERTIKELTGADVTLREPWKEIFHFNHSPLSGGDCFQDGNFYTWTVFQPIFESMVTDSQRKKILDLIHRNRPAGSVPVSPASQPPVSSTLPYRFGPPPGTSISLIFGRSKTLRFAPNLLSDNLVLSDGLPCPPVHIALRCFGERRIVADIAYWGGVDGTTTWSEKPQTWGDISGNVPRRYRRWNQRSASCSVKNES